jgi:5'-deoxynucleotidase YfbR-like HD superfamily hydrolase
MNDKQKDDKFWRKSLLKALKTPIQYKNGYIYDVNGNEIAGANHNTGAVLEPVHRSELCKELVKRFNEYKETVKVNKKTHTTILAALRYLQANRDDAIEAMSDLNDASGKETKPFLLTEEEIDALCEKINFNDLKIGVK